jgi:hypothetical protein
MAATSAAMTIADCERQKTIGEAQALFPTNALQPLAH